MSISITLEQRRAIARYGEASYPNSCCGLLLGEKSENHKKVVELDLIDQAVKFDGARPFITSLQVLPEKEQAASLRGLHVVGCFLSYPDQPARPSVNVCASAAPAFSYLLVGVRQGRAHELTSWVLSADQSAFLQEEVRSS